MKVAFSTLLVGLTCCHVPLAVADLANPLGNVFSLLEKLVDEVEADGFAEKKAYTVFEQWCQEQAQNLDHEIETAFTDKGKLEAKIEELSTDIDVASSTIEKLVGEISSNEARLKKATAVREEEHAEFMVGEKELMVTIDAIDRATVILEREMNKAGSAGSAALIQLNTNSVNGLVQALGVVVDAAGFSGSDKQRLTAFVQAQDGDYGDDDELGEPAAAKYEYKSGASGGVIDVMEDLRTKAEKELDDLRASEGSSQHAFDMLKQSLRDTLAADNKQLGKQKELKASSSKDNAGAKGELDGRVKDLTSAKKNLKETQSGCMTTAADHEASLAAREAELKVLKEGIKILKESTSGAGEQSYSFFQMGASSKARTRSGRALHLVKQLAKKYHSSALYQLASRMSSILHYGGGAGEDIFAKVKDLIKGLIAKLEEEAGADAKEHAFCVDEMAKTNTKIEELSDDLHKVSNQIDKAVAKSNHLREQNKDLNNELAALAKSQAEATAGRQESSKANTKAKAELEQGLIGVRKAIGVLRDYYGDSSAAFLQEGDDDSMEQPKVPMHSKKSGAGGSIIDLLEVIESDFAKNLATVETEESDEKAEYDKFMQEGEVTAAEKNELVKSKRATAAELDKFASDISSDQATIKSELEAVQEYKAKLEARCIAKPETYEEVKARREKELAGLKEALSILSSETSLMQRKRRSVLRGSL